MSLTPQHVTIPTDAVTLHRYCAGNVLGEQIGDPIPVSEPGRVSFPPYRGPRSYLQVAAWDRGKIACWTALAPRWGAQPTWVNDGDVVSVAVPFEGVLS
jgi:hypothetical protein